MKIDEIKKLIDELSYEERLGLLCSLQNSYVSADIANRAETNGIELSAEEIENAMHYVVYDNKFDSNISYWDNMDNAIVHALEKTIEEAIDEGLIQRYPENPDCIMVYCEEFEDHPEGWYYQSIHSVALDLYNDPENYQDFKRALTDAKS